MKQWFTRQNLNIKNYAIICLKCKKDKDSINQEVSKVSNGKKYFYQNVQFLTANNQYLSKTKK